MGVALCGVPLTLLEHTEKWEEVIKKILEYRGHKRMQEKSGVKEGQWEESE